jgi:hypothetical protein
MINPTKPSYFVLNGHTLGYVYSTQPNTFGILHASILKGSTFDRLAGFAAISPGIDILKPATLADFAEFRVCPKGHIA